MRKRLEIDRPTSFSPPAEAGQGAVELAFCLPLFLLLIAGGAEIANLAWNSVQVNNAARAGAAYGSISRANAADTADITSAAKNEAPRLSQLQVNSSQVCYCVDAGVLGTADVGCTSTDLTSCPSPKVIQMAVQVNTSAAVSPLIHYPGLPATWTVNAQATVGVEQ